MPLQNTFDLDVDFKHKSIINEPTVTQNDEVKFILNVFDDGKEFELSNVSTFTLASVRPDKVSVMSLGKLTGPNQVTFELGSTELMVTGTVDVAIQLYDAAGRVSTLPFTYKVLKDPVNNHVPSEKDQTLIELVLGQGPAILAAAEKVAEDTLEAEALRFESESNRVTSETQRVNAELSRAETEEERVTNELTRVQSENTRKTAETARIQAEEERQTNTSNAIQDVESATTEAINATESINLVLPNVLNLEYIAPYNPTTQYLKNNIVRKDKNSYIALQPSLGNAPTGDLDSPFWGVLAIGGVDGTGTGTVTSVNGIEPVNGNVTLEIPNSWNTLNDKPSSFPPSAHTHAIENVSGLQTALDSKASKTQEAWKSAVLQNGWSGSLLYRLNTIGQLEMRMVLTVGSISGLTVVTEIPNIAVHNATAITLLNNASGEINPGKLYMDASGLVRVAASGTVNFTTGSVLLATVVIPRG